MYPGKTFRPEQALQLVWRHIWLLLWAVVLGTMGAAIYGKTLPDRYVSVVRIAIEPQRVPESIVASNVPVGPEDRVYTISRELRSRPRLERIIRDLRLVPPNTPITEGMLQALRSGIDVLDVYDDQFTLSFAASDPVSAKMGAERLTELYLSENRRAREVFTQGTQEFLTAELNAVRARLLEQERRVVEYRRRFAGELPSQQPGNLQALQGTQSQLQSLRESLNRDLDRRIVLERSLAEARMQPVAPTPAQPVGAPETATAQLADAQARRRALEARLKPEHPDVQRVAVEIQALERLVRAEAAAAAPTGVAESERDGRIRQLDEDIRILNSQFADKEARATELEAAIAGYHQRIENVPMRESELVELTRDYQATQDLYQRLLGQSEEAQVAANLERQQIAEQFRVLDPARLPERPEGPARDRIVIAGAVLGLFIGVGLLVLIEYRDSSLHTENDVSEALGLPVLASIPIMVSSADRRRMYLGRFARALSASVGLAACLLTVAWSLGHVDWVR